jgi:endonuclease/exonuclease/phosphatase family metal-dependent hydrolase
MNRLRLVLLTMTLSVGLVAAPSLTATVSAETPARSFADAAKVDLVQAARKRPVATVRAGSFNIKNIYFDRRPAKQWPKRRAEIVRQVMHNRIGVLGVQEAGISRFGIFPKYWNQYLDLRAALNRAGGAFRLTVRAAHNCKDAKTSRRCRYLNRGASNAVRILYDARKFQEIRSGSVRYRHQAGGPRYLAWTVLAARSTGKRFLFTNTHLTRNSQRVKLLQWRQMVRVITKLRGNHLPVIAVGDMNASKYNPLTVEMLPAMRRAGFGDVLNQSYRVARLDRSRAKRMQNTWISSLNRGRMHVGTFGHEENHQLGAANLDYVFATNGLPVLLWKTVVNFNRRTGLMRKPVPSDHNMVMAWIRLVDL